MWKDSERTLRASYSAFFPYQQYCLSPPSLFSVIWFAPATVIEPVVKTAQTDTLIYEDEPLSKTSQFFTHLFHFEIKCSYLSVKAHQHAERCYVSNVPDI